MLPTSRFVFCFAALSLAGCASRPVNVLTPIETRPPPGAGRVELLAAATRARSPDPGQMFTGERSFELSLVGFGLSIPPPEARKTGEIQWPKRLPPDPATDFAVLEAQPLDLPQAADWARRHTPPNGRVAIFIHGYNNTFEQAIYRFAQVAYDSGSGAAAIVFSWPSRGSALEYVYDRDSATFSRDSLEQILRGLAEAPEVQEITVVGHSMGAWLTMETLRQMAIRSGRIDPKIRDVALAAPDVDVDVFATQLLAMGEERPNFTVFVSRDDRALALSQRLGGGVDRLGQIDPNTELYQEALKVANLTIIDLTGVASGDPMNHGKFAASPEIVRLLGGVISSGEIRTANDELPFGEQFTIFARGVAQTVTGAAGLALSAPGAILSSAGGHAAEPQY